MKFCWPEPQNSSLAGWCRLLRESERSLLPSLSRTPDQMLPASKPQPGTMAMLGVAQEISRELGFEMTGQSAGGGSDGNFTGYLGLPTLDSIGVRGQGLHTLNEHIEVDSLVERAKLAAGLYCRLGA